MLVDRREDTLTYGRPEVKNCCIYTLYSYICYIISIVKLLKDFALLNSFIFFVLFSDINVVLSGFSQKYFINRLGLKYMFSYINSLVSEHPNFKKKPYNPMNIHLLLV